MLEREYERTRHYVTPAALVLASPLFRYSTFRDAYVLRIAGDRSGPVLKRDRRKRRRAEYAGPERRTAIQA